VSDVVLRQVQGARICLHVREGSALPYVIFQLSQLRLHPWFGWSRCQTKDFILTFQMEKSRFPIKTRTGKAWQGLWLRVALPSRRMCLKFPASSAPVRAQACAHARAAFSLSGPGADPYPAAGSVTPFGWETLVANSLTTLEDSAHCLYLFEEVNFAAFLFSSHSLGDNVE